MVFLQQPLSRTRMYVNRYHADCKYGYQQFPYRSTCKTSSGRVSYSRYFPFRCMPGTERYPGDSCTGRSCSCKGIGLLAKDKLTTNPCTAKSDELLCNGCSTCANVCPYGAISYEEKQVNDHGIRETRHVAVVNTALCQGCGACTVACPSGAMDLQGFSNRQIIAEVDAICR